LPPRGRPCIEVYARWFWHQHRRAGAITGAEPLAPAAIALRGEPEFLAADAAGKGLSDRPTGESVDAVKLDNGRGCIAATQ
jgi:hypothetical protein